MCCTRLAKSTGLKNFAKIRHLRAIAQLCRAISSQLRHVSTIEKKSLKQQYLLHLSSQSGERSNQNQNLFAQKTSNTDIASSESS